MEELQHRAELLDGWDGHTARLTLAFRFLAVAALVLSYSAYEPFTYVHTTCSTILYLLLAFTSPYWVLPALTQQPLASGRNRNPLWIRRYLLFSDRTSQIFIDSLKQTASLLGGPLDRCLLAWTLVYLLYYQPTYQPIFHTLLTQLSDWCPLWFNQEYSQ